MNDLISRCAKVAGWQCDALGHCYGTLQQIEPYAWVDTAPTGYAHLTPAGTLWLLDRLLRARWDIGFNGAKFCTWQPHGSVNAAHFECDTIEEATMLAYLAAFEQPECKHLYLTHDRDPDGVHMRFRCKDCGRPVP
jgi:hypothetical protein